MSGGGRRRRRRCKAAGSASRRIALSSSPEDAPGRGRQDAGRQPWVLSRGRAGGVRRLAACNERGTGSAGRTEPSKWGGVGTKRGKNEAAGEARQPSGTARPAGAAGSKQAVLQAQYIDLQGCTFQPIGTAMMARACAGAGVPLPRCASAPQHRPGSPSCRSFRTALHDLFTPISATQLHKGGEALQPDAREFVGGSPRML